MIAVVDYGVGNLFSLLSSLTALGFSAEVTADKRTLERADGIILPGVGAFGDAADKLFASGLADALVGLADTKPLLGICLGMQLMFEKSYEFGEHEGLGLFKGSIRPLSEKTSLKVPHMGWNSLEFHNPSPVFKYLHDGDMVYFVHSFYADCAPQDLTAVADHGFPVTAAVGRGLTFGVQFHPEKSGKTGLLVLKAFCETAEEKN